MTARKRSRSLITNYYVEDNGRTYRVCRYSPKGRVLMVMLRSKKAHSGHERFLNVDGRRAKQIIALQEKL